MAAPSPTMSQEESEERKRQVRHEKLRKTIKKFLQGHEFDLDA